METCSRDHCTPEERAVINKALDWEALYKARAETRPEDDDLHFACERLIAANKTPNPQR